MGKIILGLVLFGAGAISYFAASNSPTGGTVWTGGMLVGALLVWRGLREGSR